MLASDSPPPLEKMLVHSYNKHIQNHTSARVESPPPQKKILLPRRLFLKFMQYILIYSSFLFLAFINFYEWLCMKRPYRTMWTCKSAHIFNNSYDWDFRFLTECQFSSYVSDGNCLRNRLYPIK